LLHRHYPVSSLLRASPQPQTAQPTSHELPVGPEFPVPLLGFPVFRVLSYACMSSSLPRQVRWKLFAHTLPSIPAFPCKQEGQHLHYGFRGLLNVYSHYNLHAHGAAETALYIEGSDDFVTSVAASIVTGWNEPVPGWGYLPLKSTGLSRRTVCKPLQLNSIRCLLLYK